MDTSLLKTLLSSVSDIAKDSKSSDKDVKDVLTSALPYLLTGKETTKEENTAVSKKTGIDEKSVSSIVNAAMPYIKKALKDVDTDKISSAVSSVVTPENLKKAAGIAGKLLKKDK